MIQVISLQFVASSVVGISPNSPGSIVTHFWFIPVFLVVIELDFHSQIEVVSITPSRLSSSNLE